MSSDVDSDTGKIITSDSDSDTDTRFLRTSDTDSDMDSEKVMTSDTDRTSDTDILRTRVSVHLCLEFQKDEENIKFFSFAFGTGKL